MQWIAIITMLIDHIGIVWFPDEPIWRIIGRLAFPIYTFYVAVGMTRTRSRRMYMQRLAVLAVISQVPFSLLFHTWTINVIGTFLVAVGAIYLMERTPSHPLRFVWIAAAAVLLEAAAFDYGAYGLLLLLLYRFTEKHTMWIGHLGLNAVYALLFSAPLQLFSLIPTLTFAFSPGSVSYDTPRWVWRSFYPAHLAVLLGLSWLMTALPPQ